MKVTKAAGRQTVAIVSTLRDTFENTMRFIRHHQSLGINRMFLFFDDPDDDAAEYLVREAGVSSFRRGQAYPERDNTSVQDRQEANAGWAFAQAGREQIRWLLHLDCDELLWSRSSISDLFRWVPDNVDVLRFPVMESIPADASARRCLEDGLFFKEHLGITLFNELFEYDRTQLERHQRRVVFWRRRHRIFAILARFARTNSEKAVLFGHLHGKAATRTTARIDQVSQHFPVPRTGERLVAAIAADARVLHLDCLDFEHWKKKWSARTGQGNQFDLCRLSPDRQMQFQRFFKAEKQGGMALHELYRHYYQLSSLEKVLLLRAGLVKKVTIRNC